MLRYFQLSELIASVKNLPVLQQRSGNPALDVLKLVTDNTAMIVDASSDFCTVSLWQRVAWRHSCLGAIFHLVQCR